VLDAARSLFAERGFAACRVTDIARQAGMSSGNVYWLFESKDAVLRAILTDGFAALEASVSAVADEYGPARRKLDILIARTIDFYRHNEALMTILGSLNGEGGQELLGRLGIDREAIEDRRRAGLRRVFAEARSEGAVSGADPDLLVTLYVALFDGLLAGDRRRWIEIPLDDLRDAALRVVGYRPAG
jgi:TetR/AcrR family fatty acid metabolism transcriptional regulator